MDWARCCWRWRHAQSVKSWTWFPKKYLNFVEIMIMWNFFFLDHFGTTDETSSVLRCFPAILLRVPLSPRKRKSRSRSRDKKKRREKSRSKKRSEERPALQDGSLPASIYLYIDYIGLHTIIGWYHKVSVYIYICIYTYIYIYICIYIYIYMSIYIICIYIYNIYIYRCYMYNYVIQSVYTYT